MNRRFALKSILAAGVATLASVLGTKNAKAATTHKVDISGFRFKPKKLNVAVGDTIVFKNSDSSAHTATASDFSWKTDALDRGDTSEVQVVSGMQSTYFCEFHPQMKGKLVIEG